MNDRGFRRWALLGALASTALLAPACENQKWPKTGGEYEGIANESQALESFGEQRPAESPATGGSGTPQQGAATGIDWSKPQQQTAPGLGQPVQDGPGPHDAFGVHGSQGGIGAPGYSTPEEGVAGPEGDRVQDEPGLEVDQRQEGRRRQLSPGGQVEGGNDKSEGSR